MLLWLSLIYILVVFLLYCVHEALLGAIEEDDCEEHDDEEGDGAIEQAPDVEGADAKAGIFECLEDRSEGIDVEECLILLRCEGEGVDDWGGIHQELDTETDEHVEVTVFGGERGDDESPRHSVESYHRYKDREKKNVPRDSEIEVLEQYEVNVDEYEHEQLDAEAYQVTSDT